jgi:hypothetical protein
VSALSRRLDDDGVLKLNTARRRYKLEKHYVFHALLPLFACSIKTLPTFSRRTCYKFCLQLFTSQTTSHQGKMSTSRNLRIPLTIPPSLQQSNKYVVQLSLRNEDLDSEIFMKRYEPSDLTTSAQDGSMSITLRREEIPRFNKGTGNNELFAHFWKGQKLVESVGLGIA